MLRTAMALLALCASALASDYQCQRTEGCIAYLTKNGVVKAVNFRKGDIVCTEDGWWDLYEETGWKKIKKNRQKPQAALGAGSAYLFETSAQARGPFVIYRAISPAVSRRWNGTLVLVSTGEFVASGYDTPTGPGWMEVGKQKGKL